MKEPPTAEKQLERPQPPEPQVKTEKPAKIDRPSKIEKAVKAEKPEKRPAESGKAVPAADNLGKRKPR